MPETERSIEDLRALYRSLGMSEETLERAIQFGFIKASEKMVKPRPLSGATLAKRPEGRKRTQSAPAAVPQEPAQRALALKQRPRSQILADELKKIERP